MGSGGTESLGGARMRRALLVLGSIIGLAATSPAYATTGLVASWRFDEGSGAVLHDTSGFGNNGVISGDVQWVSGLSSSALSFDGNTGRVRVPDSSSLDPASAVSVSVWVRAAGLPGDFKYILAKGASGCLAASYGLYTGPNGGLMFYVARNRGLSYTRSPDGGRGVWNGDWHFVVGTYNGSSVRLYVDGNQVGNSTPATGPIDYAFPDNDLFMGHYNTCPALDFHGQIDTAKIYSGALTASDVRTNYDQPTGTGGGGTASTGTSPSPTLPGSDTRTSPGGIGQSASDPDASSQPGRTEASVSGLANGKPHLVILLSARDGTNPIKSFTVTLPAGLRFARTLVQLRNGVSLAKRLKHSVSLSHGQMVVRLNQPQRSLTLVIGEPAVTETSNLVERVHSIARLNRARPRAKKRVLVLNLGMRLTDVKAKSASLHAPLRVS
jgi:hypothetical protein